LPNLSAANISFKSEQVPSVDV